MGAVLPERWPSAKIFALAEQRVIDENIHVPTETMTMT
jgi:hypothetical protein